MRVEPHPAEIRRFVARSFEEFADDPAIVDDFEERILVHEGGYRARSYRAGDYLAMWLVEVGILQFYDADGNMLMTVNLCKESSSTRQAA